MKLDRVTITGADDTVSPRDLADISRRYPFVEWGILFSQSRQGQQPRYPSWRWVQRMINARNHEPRMVKLSAHLCGTHSEVIFVEGNTTILGEYARWTGVFPFERVQLNGFSAVEDTSKIKTVLDTWTNVNFIMQVQSYDAEARARLLHDMHPNVHLLWDESGGHGKETDSWAIPTHGAFSPVYTGYAGGLGPHNVTRQLEVLSRMAGDGPIESKIRRTFWIDMESKVRSNNDDQFDLDKVIAVLVQAEPYTRSL